MSDILSYKELYRDIDESLKTKFNTKTGVGEYINCMNSEFSPIKRNIPNWGVTLYYLRKAKSLFDQLSHCENPRCDSDILKSNMNKLLDFKAKISTDTDPLTLLNAEKERIKAANAVAPKKRFRAKNKGDIPNCAIFRKPPKRIFKRVSLFCSAVGFATGLAVKSLYNKLTSK